MDNPVDKLGKGLGKPWGKAVHSLGMAKRAGKLSPVLPRLSPGFYPGYPQGDNLIFEVFSNNYMDYPHGRGYNYYYYYLNSIMSFYFSNKGRQPRSVHENSNR